MTDELPFHYPGEAQAVANGARGTGTRHRHQWERRLVADPGVELEDRCVRCGAIKGASSRRGKSSARLGKDQERRIERVYGPRKVGEFGDAVDHLGRDFKWQAKATRKAPPGWLAAITEPTWRGMIPLSALRPMAHMDGLGGTRRPLVIRSYVHQGLPTRDWIFVLAIDWLDLHGAAPIELGYMVMSGSRFLDIHGRDEE